MKTLKKLWSPALLFLTVSLCASADLIQDAVTADSPYAYFRMDDPTGTTLSSEAGPIGTYVGAPQLGVAGIPGGGGNHAVNFDGVDDIARILDATNPIAYTLELWVKLDQPVDTGYRNFIKRTDAGESGAYSHILQVANGKFVHYTFDGAAKLITGTTPVLADTWYHVVGVYDPGVDKMELWVNGGLEATYTGGALNNPWAGGDRWILAKNHSTSNSVFDGTLDEIAIYHTALTGQQIQAHYQAGLVPEPASLSLFFLGTVFLRKVRRFQR